MLIRTLAVLLILPTLATVPQCVAAQQECDGARVLLDRLEKAHAEVEVFSSPLTYRKEYALEGDFETRLGDVATRGQGDEREIILYFDRVVDSSGHGTERPRYHVYENGWWIEVDPGRKRVVYRQLAVEGGESANPFELGEGSFPLPIGQKADRVVERFDVTLTGVPDDPLFKGIKNAHVLHLVPKPGTPGAERNASVDLIFDRETLLPVGILVVHLNGDRTTAWLRSPKAAADDASFTGRAAEARKLLERASTDEGWSVERKPIRSGTPESSP